MRAHKQNGFTLVEMIVVIVITGIIAGIVAVFIRAPMQGYVDSARRAELTDVADTAVRRLARDIRTAVPNSIRTTGCGVPCVEFLPTKDGGRYRAQQASGVGDVLNFDAADGSFDVIGSAIVVVGGDSAYCNLADCDHIVVGSTQSDGNPPYLAPATDGSIRRTVAAAGTVNNISVTATAKPLPASARLWDANPPSQRFDVVDGTQDAVTYACEGTLGALDANGNGQAKLVRHWKYGFNEAQLAPVGGSSALLANNVSGCVINYVNPVNPATGVFARFGLVEIHLTLTQANESVSLFNEIHVSNAP